MIKEKYFLTHSNLAHLDPYFDLVGVTEEFLTMKSASFLSLVKERVEKIYPDLDIEVINLSELQANLIQKIESELDLSEYFVISLEEDWLGQDGFKLEICRAEDLHGHAADYCARPGFDDPDTQLKRAVELSGNKKILITDDGLFSGKTVLKVVEDLRSQGKQDLIVYVLVATDEGVERFNEFGIKVHCLRSLDIPKDWVCERDLRYCIARTGKPVVSERGQLLSIEHDGRKTFFSRPYPLPTGNLNQAASIPDEHVKDFSKFVLEWHIELFTELEVLAGPITLGDLSKLSSLHSIPYAGYIPDMNTTIKDHLVSLLRSL